MVVWFDNVPPPLTVHVTPAPFWSFVTAAVSVVLSVPSTVDAAAVTLTLIGLDLLPPQPDRQGKVAHNNRSPHKDVHMRSPERASRIHICLQGRKEPDPGQSTETENEDAE